MTTMSHLCIAICERAAKHAEHCKSWCITDLQGRGHLLGIPFQVEVRGAAGGQGVGAPQQQPEGSDAPCPHIPSKYLLCCVLPSLLGQAHLRAPDS